MTVDRQQAGRWACWRWALGVRRAGAGSACRVRGACRARAAGGHESGSRAWCAQAAWALGGTGAGAQGGGAHERAAAGATSVRGSARTAGSGARGVRSRGGRRAAWALGTRPRRLGWPGLCTRCTRLDFQTGFRLGIFPESVNEHCSL